MDDARTGRLTGTWSHPLVLAAGSMLDQPDDVVIDAAADAGFDGVGLRISTGRTTTEISEIRNHADRKGISIHDTEVYRITDGAIDPGELIERTVAVGASALLVVSDLMDRRATLRALADLTERCRAAGVRVGLEFMAWTLPSTPLDAIEIAERVDCELVVDVLHHIRVGAGPDELRAIVEAGRLGWVQLCDASADGERTATHAALIHEARHGRRPPGDGGLPLGPLLRCLPPDVTISVEVQDDSLLTIPPQQRARLLLDATRAVLDAHAPSSTG